MVLMRFAKWMVPFRASESPRIREKPLRAKSAAGDSVPVRVRSPAPEQKPDLIQNQIRFLFYIVKNLDYSEGRG